MVAAPTPEDGRLLARPPSLARRRPVLSFLGVMALVGLVLAGVGRSGVAAPQVRMRATGSVGGGPEVCAAVYTLANEGLRPVEVEGVSWGAGVGLVPSRTGLPTAAHPPFEPFTLAGRSHREISFAHPCDDPGPGPDPDLGTVPVVHVRSVDLGLHRAITPS